MITVLTATYNRHHTLERLFASLLAQSIYEFEWVIIDDGSVDDTSSLIQSFAEKAPFRVIYVFQENAGKHVAINNGVSHASGDFVFIVDSDDVLTDRAIESIVQAIDKAAKDIVGVCFRKSYFNGIVIGKNSNSSQEICMNPSAAGAFFGGDLAYVFRKSSLMKHPFPIIAGEKFVPELYLWNRIGDQGKIVYYPNLSICLCEYLPDGYSANFKNNLKKNPKGFRIFYADQFYREKSIIGRVKCAIRTVQCLFYEIIRGFRQ